MKKRKLRSQMKRTLNGLYHLGKGTPRKDIKDKHNWTPFIHSSATYKTYLRECNKFCDYAQKEFGYNKLDENIDEVVYQYIEHLKRKGLAPHSIATALNGIAKGLKRKAESFDIELPKRKRENITRSRLERAYDKHFQPENHKDLVTFQRCFGLRKDKELAVITLANITDDGKDLYCKVKGKGGKIRTVKAYGTEEEKAQIREYLKTRPHGSKIFPKIPAAFDAHAVRAEYASRVYHAHARDIKTLSGTEERYVCRGDMKGKVYDRQALIITSKMLGHNRTDVVVNNYAWKF